MEEMKYMYSFICNDCGHSYVTDQKEICPFCESENLNVYQTVTYIDCKCGNSEAENRIVPLPDAMPLQVFLTFPNPLIPLSAKNCHATPRFDVERHCMSASPIKSSFSYFIWVAN